MVVIEVEIQRLPQEIQAVEMVQAFDVCGISAAIFLGDLNLGIVEA